MPRRPPFDRQSTSLGPPRRARPAVERLREELVADHDRELVVERERRRAERRRLRRTQRVPTLDELARELGLHEGGER